MVAKPPGRAGRPHIYDTTQAKRQAKRRALFNQMREALTSIAEATTLDEAKAIAREGLDAKIVDK